MMNNDRISNRMKIVFFGTPSFIEPIIEAIQKNHDLVKIIRSPQDFNNATIEQLNNLKPDLFIVAAYGQILNSKLLSVPKLGSINIHPSLLPKYRGPSPVQSSILSGDEKTGITIIKMDEKVDHGPILYQSEERILPNDTFESLAKRLFSISANSITDVITRYNDDQTGKIQDESKATYTKLLTKQDGYVDSNNPPTREYLERMIRAYFPWPGTWTKSLIINHKSLIIKFLPEQKLQVEGKKPMSFKDFINGYPKKGEELLIKLGLN